MAMLSQLASEKTGLLWTTLISALVSAAISYSFKRKEIRHKAKVEYEYEQRKKLHELTGKYHGRLIGAANALNYRLWNLYSNHEENWLVVNGNWRNPGYYFTTTIHRFMGFFALVRLVEAEAILLDARIATKKDFIFLNYVAAFHWVMTDVALFDSVPYDKSKQTDHFFSDYFRYYCDLCAKDNAYLSFEAFTSGPMTKEQFHPVLHYFDGLSPHDGRLRWDRIVSLHLLLMAFINTFGYERQRSPLTKFENVVKQTTSGVCVQNLVKWLPRYDLGREQGAKNIVKAVSRVYPN
jgi:hypothetical protein